MDERKVVLLREYPYEFTMHAFVALFLSVFLLEGGEVLAASAAASSVTPTLTTGAGSVFNPFPTAGAAAPLVSSNTSVFNPFPFTGATAPLISTSTVSSGSAPAPFVSIGVVISASTSSGVLIQNPEPSSVILLGTGLVWLAWLIRKRFLQAT